MWTVPTWQAGAQLGAAAIVLAALPFADGAGRLLLLPIAVLLGAFGVRDLVLRPVLTAGRDGLTVVDGVHRVGSAWHDVERMRVVKDRRTPLLELDLGDTVVVLTARRLGAPVDDVLTELQALSR